jgi:hypothetical protein
METFSGEFANPLIKTCLGTRNQPSSPLSKAVIVPPWQEGVSEERVDICSIEQAGSSDIIGDVSMWGSSGLLAKPR